MYSPRSSVPFNEQNWAMNSNCNLILQFPQYLDNLFSYHNKSNLISMNFQNFHLPDIETELLCPNNITISLTVCKHSELGWALLIVYRYVYAFCECKKNILVLKICFPGVHIKMNPMRTSIYIKKIRVWLRL